MPKGVCTPRQYKPLRTRMSSLRNARSVSRCCDADADEPGKSVKRQNRFELRGTRAVDLHCCVCSCLTVRRLSLAVLAVMASSHSDTSCCSNSPLVTALSLLSPPAAGRPGFSSPWPDHAMAAAPRWAHVPASEFAMTISPSHGGR